MANVRPSGVIAELRDPVRLQVDPAAAGPAASNTTTAVMRRAFPIPQLWPRTGRPVQVVKVLLPAHNFR